VTKGGHQEKIVLAAVGDVAFDFVEPSYPFRYVEQILASADLRFANLETVLSDRALPALEKRWSFRAPITYVEHLQRARFDIVNLANNHTLDFGRKGLADTMRVLERNGIQYVGAGWSRQEAESERIFSLGEMRIAVLGYWQGSRPPIPPEHGPFLGDFDQVRIEEEIRRLNKAGVEAIIVSLHWGMDKATYPFPKQQALGRSLIELGASVVLGHGPHVVQGFERYRRGVIAYSIGNFQMEYRPGEETARSVIAFFDVYADGSAEYMLRPIRLNQCFLPVPVGDEEAECYLQLIRSRNEKVESSLVDREVLEEVAWTYLSNSLQAYAVRIRRYGSRHALECAKWAILPSTWRFILALLRRHARLAWRRMCRLVLRSLLLR